MVQLKTFMSIAALKCTDNVVVCCQFYFKTLGLLSTEFVTTSLFGYT